jgi:hypothetical protein
MVRKLSLTGFLLFVPAEYDMLRLLLAFTVSLAFLVATLLLRPFRTDIDTAFSTSVQISTILTLFCVAGVKLCGEGYEQTCGSLGMSPFEFSLLILIFGILMTLLLCMHIGLALRHHRMGTVRLRKDNRQPYLHLVQGMRFHVFLSHSIVRRTPIRPTARVGWERARARHPLPPLRVTTCAM